MPSVRYYNQTAPFWDFVANMEAQGRNHPLFGGRGESDSENEQYGGWPFGRMPHRGHRGPPGPPGPPPPPEAPQDPNAPPPPPEDEPEAGPSRHGHGFRGRHGGRGNCHGRGRGFRHGGPPFGGPWDFMRGQFFGEDAENKNEDFKPEADVFDTADSFVIHVALPGAKKEDVGVNWDAERSELSIAGVIYRPGDEDFLKTLALDERRVGAFEKKIRLGSRASPAQVDVDAITAKMEDGVLTVDVPKLDSGYVEVKKVDIE